ncbi:MAG: 30S ribosomal protein S16 [Candidatus Omnitrophica bacterium]|nr:30S ribosomal protein S16 [Candidatus Omnitrophota bacterium]MDD5670175.1 30S ribosomal protein S16 [Candidatus Omnitrophota bacterium]
MVKIRLKRTGTNNQPKWRIVVADVKMPRDGRFIEEIGYYNAIPVQEVFEIKKERLEYWVKQGAQMSVTLKALLKRMEKKARRKAAV